MLLRINSFYIPPTNVSSKPNDHRKPCSMSSFYDQHRYSQPPTSRTQRKLWLQRQYFLTDDKNYLDHPTNMKRLTKEMDRVNREYRCLLHYQDPLLDSIKRVMTKSQSIPSTSSSLSTSPSLLPSPGNSYLSPSIRTHHKSLMTRLKQQCRHF